ncbi:MAG: alpha/beta fold hydrolase [Phycisphaerales bacterium]|nr:alpha/beta fold hydrolase [Phycisphaerales bacterium]
MLIVRSIGDMSVQSEKVCTISSNRDADPWDAHAMTIRESILVLAVFLTAVIATPTFAQVPPDQVPVRLPDNYDPAQPAPLIVALHGYTGSGDNPSSSLFNIWPKASTKGFLYVSPTGSQDWLGNNFWNATDACCDFFNTGVDHVGYLKEMIESIQSSYNVDPHAIHLIGHSNGGFMCHAMACEHPELIASITAVAGSGYADPLDCPAGETVHVLQVHGTADDVIEYDGGSIWGVSYPGAWDTVEDWALRNGCGALESTVLRTINVDGAVSGEETLVRMARDCDAGGSAELWALEGSSHGPSMTNVGREAILQYMLDHSGLDESDCPGDVTGDRLVTVEDLLRVLEAFGQTGDFPEDLNQNQIVDINDLMSCIDVFGTGC